MQLKTGLAIVLLAIGTAAAQAQQPAPPVATPASAKPAPATTPAAATPATSPPDAAAAKPSAASKSSPQHFEPTEKVRPDFDVAFPVDI